MPAASVIKWCLLPSRPRTGTSGALEKPCRSTGQSWWLSAYGDTDDGEPHDDRDDEGSLATIEAFQAELGEAGPGSVRTFARFMPHLSEEEVRELDRRLPAVLDEYIQTDHQRLDRPALGGIVVLHQLADPAPSQPGQGTFGKEGASVAELAQRLGHLGHARTVVVPTPEEGHRGGRGLVGERAQHNILVGDLGGQGQREQPDPRPGDHQRQHALKGERLVGGDREGHLAAVGLGPQLSQQVLVQAGVVGVGHERHQGVTDEVAAGEVLFARQRVAVGQDG
jgi:hypothetical protein